MRGALCRGISSLFTQDHANCPGAEKLDPKTADERLREAVEFLQETPLALLPERWNNHLLEMLEIYSDDARPAVRAAACADLRNIAPERKVANCR